MQLGPYEVLEELGRGGMGRVLRARAPDGREVAIKVLVTTKPETLARFDRERRLLASFGEDEGFVPLIDAGSSSAGPYVVMPLVTGGTLRKRLAAGPLSLEETLALGRSLAHALGVAHERGIVHRDLKPENVLFTSDGRPLLADLGLAKHFWSDGFRGTSPVEAFAASASPYGALDMAGNVWNWCADLYDENAHARLARGEPSVPTAGNQRAFRGGSFPRPFFFACSTGRNHDEPGLTSSDIGFRVVLRPR